MALKSTIESNENYTLQHITGIVSRFFLEVGCDQHWHRCRQVLRLKAQPMSAPPTVFFLRHTFFSKGFDRHLVEGRTRAVHLARRRRSRFPGAPILAIVVKIGWLESGLVPSPSGRGGPKGRRGGGGNCSRTGALVGCCPLTPRRVATRRDSARTRSHTNTESKKQKSFCCSRPERACLLGI